MSNLRQLDTVKRSEMIYIKFSILFTTIVGVWVLFSVPVVFYHLQQQDEADVSNYLPANYSVPIRNCSLHFSRNSNTGYCSPVCGEWKEFSSEQVIAFASAASLLYLLHFIGIVITLTFSCYNYKIMFTFPAILLVYYMVSPILVDIEFFIRLIGQDHLLCSSRDLLHTLQHSTNYCYFSGILNIFTFTLLSYWWLFLTIVIFWNVWFPVNARNARVHGYTKYMHIGVVVLSLVLSTIPVVSALGSGGYVISVFPPFLYFCFPRNSAVVFYSFVFIFCIVLPIGSTFNLLTLWKVVRVTNTLKQSSKLRAECKLLVFFFNFAIATALSLIFFIIGLRNASENQQGFMEYFACEAFGDDPNDPCIFEVDRRNEIALTIASLFFFTLGPYAILVYAMPVDKLKRKYKMWRKQPTHTTTSESKS